MKEETVHLPARDSDAPLRELINGRVFHITTSETAKSIVEAGAILANPRGERTGPYGGTNSYFRTRNCVSLFDYRVTDFEKFYFYHTQCYPIQGMTETRPYSIFFLSPLAYHKLISWESWKAEGSTLRIVAHLEVGYPDRIPMSEIDAITTVHRPDIKDGLSFLLGEALKRQRQRRCDP